MPSFTPPTHEESIRTLVPPLRYYRLTWANSVVRVNGVFTSIRTPSTQTIAASGGVEGTDFFRGGRTYYVTDAVAAELETAGFSVTPAGGFGTGRFGLTPYGE